MSNLEELNNYTLEDDWSLGAAYIRVSTGKQEELSPDSQKRLILDYAKAHHIIISEEHIFMENGISGRKADKRPQFQQMIGLAKAKKFQVILLWKFSRFARNQEESIVYKSMLKKVGVDVVSISEPLVDGPFGSLIERIIEWMDEFYSIRLSGDVTRGMTEKAMRGGYQSRPPLGYMVPYHNAIPQIVPEEAEIVCMIFDSYVNDKASIFQITKNLNALGLKTSRNKPFEKRSIEYILDNPCYTGQVRWNRTENATNTIKPEDEWIIRPGKQDSIISIETFEAAQTRRKEEYHPRGERPSETYKHWLSGILKCSSCGRSLTASAHKNRYNKIYFSFQCYGYSKGKCTVSHSISTLKIEPIVLNSIKNALDTGNIKYDTHQPTSLQSDDQLLIQKKQLDQVILKEKRIMDAYINGIFTLEEYKENKNKLEAEKTRLEKEVEDLSNVDENIDKIMFDRLSSVYEILISNDDVGKKSSAIKSIVEKIVFNKDDLQIDVCYYYKRIVKT